MYHVGTFLLVSILATLLVFISLPSGLETVFQYGCWAFFGIPEITVTMRRLNDLEHSRWWTFLLFVPVVDFVFFFYLLCSPGKL